MTINYKSYNGKIEYTYSATPVTIGTDKQITWANELKICAIRTVLVAIEKINYDVEFKTGVFGSPEYADKVDAMRKQYYDVVTRLDKIINSKVFIDARNGYSNDYSTPKLLTDSVRSVVAAHKL